MKAKYLFLVTICMIAAITMTSCGGSKKVSSSSVARMTKLDDRPFRDFKTDKEYYRAIGVGVSPAEDVAEMLAAENASFTIARGIEVFTQYVIKRYTDQHTVNTTNDLDQHMQVMGKTVVKQFLQNARVVDTELYADNATGDYRCYVAMEMPFAGLEKALKDGMTRLSSDVKERIKYNEKEFQKEFEESLLEYDFNKTLK